MARGTSIIVPLVLALLASSALAQQQLRRVRVRTRPLAASVEEPQAEARSVETAPQVQYYAAQTEEEAEPETVVLVQPPRQRANQYFGNQLARQDDEYRAPLRPQGRATSAQQTQPRTKEHTRAPPVQTLRNYNTINDDGSFTFGYEAADGSFKEETRGVDCVVRGKYGYIDPDGNKREFTYVSGNPCDPNNPDPEEDERELEDEDSEENIPVRPNRPIQRPVQTIRSRPTPAPANVPTHAVFQNNFVHGERIQAKVQPQVPITPRPVTHLRATEPPATTYRPTIQNYPVTTQRPIQQQNSFYTTSPAAHSTTAFRRPQAIHATTPSSIDFDAELKKFQLEAGAPTLRPTTVAIKSRPVTQNSIHAQQTFAPRPTVAVQTLQTPSQRAPATSNQFYSSQLVFDPSTGQYNNVLYQNLPKGGGDFSSNHRLQAFVQPQQQHQQQLFQPQHSFQPSFSAPRPAAPAPQQTPAASPAPQFVTPAPHYAQQQFVPRPAVPAQNPAQSFYYINPNLRNQYSTGQIDAFLRGHNLQF